MPDAEDWLEDEDADELWSRLLESETAFVCRPSHPSAFVPFEWHPRTAVEIWRSVCGEPEIRAPRPPGYLNIIEPSRLALFGPTPSSVFEPEPTPRRPSARVPAGLPAAAFYPLIAAFLLLDAVIWVLGARAS